MLILLYIYYINVTKYGLCSPLHLTSGLIPPRYVLAMVMTSAILLRRGFTGLLISLLVVRAGSHILLILRDEQHRVSSVDRDDLWEREGFKPPPTRTASTNT